MVATKKVYFGKLAILLATKDCYAITKFCAVLTAYLSGGMPPAPLQLQGNIVICNLLKSTGVI